MTRRRASVWGLLKTLAGLPIYILVYLIEGLFSTISSALDNC